MNGDDLTPNLAGEAYLRLVHSEWSSSGQAEHSGELAWQRRVFRGRCCTVLYCTVLHCTALYSTILYCTVLYCTVLYCTVLYCTVFCGSYLVKLMEGDTVIDQKEVEVVEDTHVVF